LATDGIREWLDGLELGEYAEAFEAEKIDLRALPDVTEADLKEMGLPIGPRRVVLRAVSSLAVSEGAPEPAQSEQPTRPLEAERRQITVMFCDLVGSTALSEQLDPEDLRGLMQAYQQAAGSVIERYGGHVAQYLGDGLMTYFGWPQAHEDDAEWAVRASLEIVEAVKSVEAPAPLQVRVGIATGPVVVGETGAGDASVPKLAVGETPNIAARLQGLADPDTIIIGHATQRLLGSTFELDDLGDQELKGIPLPVPAWRVSGLAITEGRFEAQHPHLTPLVGREAEMAMVMARWEQAKAGEGRVILLSGEPGIGKSRVTQQLLESVAEQPHIRLRYQCSPYHTGSALYPIIQQIERAAGFALDDTVDAKLDKLEGLLVYSQPSLANNTEAGSLRRRTALLAALLSLPMEHFPLQELSPQRRKDETLETLLLGIADLATQQPVLILFEDVHWIDPTTQEFLDRLIAALPPSRMLLLITHRPEYAPSWLGQAHVLPLALSRLGRQQVAEMAQVVTGGKTLPRAVLDEIIVKTDGVPLFIEELTTSMLEAGLLRETADEYVLDGPLPQLAIPVTLKDSLMARLDRLEFAKEVAQIGACIGREFSYELLAAVSPSGGSGLAEALGHLTDSTLIAARGMPPQSTYVFKHALVQDAAYESLLKANRQELHARIAKAMEEHFADSARAAPEVVAHHYAAASMTEPAVKYLLDAGKLALSRAAGAEAIAHLRRGLTLLEELSMSHQRDQLETTIQMTLGNALLSHKGYGAAETGLTFARAFDLGLRLNEVRRLLPAIYGLWVYHLVRGEFEANQQDAEAFQSHVDAATDGETGWVVMSQRMMGTTHFFRGDMLAARTHLAAAVASYEPRLHQTMANVYGQDPGVSASCVLALSLWHLGYLDQSREVMGHALALAAESQHHNTQAYAWFHALFLDEYRQDWNAAERAAERMLEFTEKNGMEFWAASAATRLAAVKIRLGNANTAPKDVHRELQRYFSTGSVAYASIFRYGYALAQMAAGLPDDAIATLDEAVAAAERVGERAWLPLLYAKRADVLLTSGDNKAAESSYVEAMKVARTSKSRIWEIRAATSLVRLWQSQGKITEAHDLLAPVYDWFIEGFDTPDLIDAKALLDELAAA
jgi:class 3 adenylate cyclase/predicted negative regulator of RcsB-dependent stress response